MKKQKFEFGDLVCDDMGNLYIFTRQMRINTERALSVLIDGSKTPSHVFDLPSIIPTDLLTLIEKGAFK